MIKISGTPPNDMNIYQAQTEKTICVSYVKYPFRHFSVVHGFTN